MISHAEAQTLISERLDNPLDPYINDVLNAHIASCDECRAFADSSARLATTLRSMPILPASPLVRQNVWAAIESQNQWWQRFTGAMTGQTAAIVSTAAIALIVIAFSAVAIMRLVETDSGDPDAQLAAPTQESVALATQTTASSELALATETVPSPTTTPEPEPDAETAAPTATAQPEESPTEAIAPTATIVPTVAPTEEPAPTETPADDTELAMADAPTTVPPTEADDAADSTEAPLTDLTGDSFPTAVEENVEDSIPAESTGFNPASLFATEEPVTETPVPDTEEPSPTAPTDTPAPATEAPPTVEPATETPSPAPTEVPDDTEVEEESTSPPIEPIDGQPIGSAGPTPAEAAATDAEQPTNASDLEALQIIEAIGTEEDSGVGGNTEPSIGPPDDDDDDGEDDGQVIVPVDATAELAEDDGPADLTGMGEESTPEADEADDDSDSASGSYDLADTPFYSDGNLWGSPNDRLGFTGQDVIFSGNPDGVSLNPEGVDVQTVTDENSQSLEICVNGNCTNATTDSGNGSFTDEPIGWVDGRLIYQRVGNGNGQDVEIRAVEWNGGPVSDQELGTIEEPVTPLAAAYPVSGGTLIPTDQAWLLISGGSAEAIDSNPYGDIRLVRTNHSDDVITYVAGGELVVASVSSPGTAISSIPFSGVDYDLAPDGQSIAISTGSGIEVVSLDGTVIGASDTGLDTGSVLWRSSGIVFIDLTNNLIRLVDPAQLQP